MQANRLIDQSQTITVLIVKLSSLGDVVQTVPVVHDILKHYPNAAIDWVVEEAFAPLLRQVKGLRHVIPVAQRRWRKVGIKQFFTSNLRQHICKEKKVFLSQLHSTHYDAVIDAQGLIKSGLITRQAILAKTSNLKGIKPFKATFANRSQTCGYEWPVRWVTNVHVPMPKRIHAIQRTRLLCAKSLGYELDIFNAPASYDWDLSRDQIALSGVQSKANRYNAQPNDSENQGEISDASVPRSVNMSDLDRPYVLFVHGSSRVDNAWPVEYWQTLAKQLVEKGYSVVLPQSSVEELTNARCIAFGIPYVLILERCDLVTIAKLIQDSSAVVGLDTGLSHMAVALNKPCLQIFLHDRAWRAGPMEGVNGKIYQQFIAQHQSNDIVYISEKLFEVL